MKASEIPDLKDGDVIRSPEHGARFVVQYKVPRQLMARNLHCHDRELSTLPGDDWQLLTPAPKYELGEPVRFAGELVPGEPIIVEHENGAFRQQHWQPGFHYHRIYRDPRPLPTLPAKEPRLKERIRETVKEIVSQTIESQAMSATEIDAFTNHIAALLESEARNG